MVSRPQICAFKRFIYLPESLGWACLILVMWLVSLAGTFTLFNAQTPWGYVVWGVLVRTFLHTGLFIVAHEAIHENISGLHQLNAFFGYVTSGLYALLPYRLLAKNHRLHHRFPATEKDPDYHEVNQGKFCLWYIQFMKTYQIGRQIWVTLVGISLIFSMSIYQVSIPIAICLFFIMYRSW